MAEFLGAALDASAREWFSIGLGVAFVAAILSILAFMRWSNIDHGFLGLMFLLTVLFFLISFSFLIAASVKGLDIKIAIAGIDALVLIGSKLLTPRFIEYLESGDD